MPLSVGALPAFAGTGFAGAMRTFRLRLAVVFFSSITGKAAKRPCILTGKYLGPGGGEINKELRCLQAKTIEHVKPASKK